MHLLIEAFLDRASEHLQTYSWHQNYHQNITNCVRALLTQFLPFQTCWWIKWQVKYLYHRQHQHDSIMTSSSSLCWTLLSSLHSSLGVIAPSLTNIYNRGGFVTFELSCRRCLCFLKPQESSRIVPTLYSTDFLVQDAVKSPVNQIIYITCLICEPQIRTFLHRIKRKSRHGFR